MRLMIWASGDPSTWYLAIEDSPIKYFCKPDALDSGTEKTKAQQFIEGIAYALLGTVPAGATNRPNVFAPKVGPPPRPLAEWLDLPDPAPVAPFMEADAIWVANPLFGVPDDEWLQMTNFDAGETLADVVADAEEAELTAEEIAEFIASLFA